MITHILLLTLGFLLLIKGADWLVNGATALAKNYQISDLAIGLTIVAFGTSAPEMVVNVIAAYQDHQQIVFGNIIGSNNFNTFIILGIAGLITPLVVQSNTVWREIPLSLLAVVIFYLLANNFFFDNTPMLSRIDGVVLLIGFGLFLWYVYSQLKTRETTDKTEVLTNKPLKIWGLIALGLACLVGGGNLIVNHAIALASEAGISQRIIGLTIVAAGTSLPELATTIVAAMKKNRDIAVGNIIGSNIFNIFFILGVSSLVRPLKFDTVNNFDIYLLLLGTLILFLAMFTGGRKKLDRWEAFLLLAIYLFYMGFLLAA